MTYYLKSNQLNAVQGSCRCTPISAQQHGVPFFAYLIIIKYLILYKPVGILHLWPQDRVHVWVSKNSPTGTP